jgi:two-component system, OmpR family, phosphate regulon sensor histidine kinase PhoR
MFTSIRWRMIVPYTVIILVTTLGLTLYLSGQVRRIQRLDLEAQLLIEARLMADYAADHLMDPLVDTEELAVQVQDWARLSSNRVTLIGMDGTVLGDSEVDPASMENHLYRAEISQAIQAGEGAATRFSRTLGADAMYGAVLIRRGGAPEGEPLGVMRVAISLSKLELMVGRLSRTIIVTGLLVAVFSVLLAMYVSARTVNPIRQLTGVVERVAQGDMRARLLPTTHDEVGQLTRAFNTMADELNDQVTLLAQERTFLSGVLQTMTDGVIITDENGVVLLTNPAALQILAFPGKTTEGRTFAQVTRDRQLVELWEACRRSSKEQTATVESGGRNVFLQAVITPLGASAAPRFLVILQNLTRIRRLETVRRDFISNISHELRTPLASLSLVVETLKDGAIDDPEAAHRFLSFIEVELGTLTQMVEELLELSQIESGQVPFRLKVTPVAKLVKKPVKRLALLAERTNIAVELDIPDDIPPVLADSRRIQQVVMNLLHNALKFTPEGGYVTLRAEVVGPEVVVSVKDTGEGIPADDVPRIFERFYKADRARAEEGVGLGLSIAKHVIQGHGGRIWVESVEGRGSTFYFSLLIGEFGQAEADED